MSCSVGNSMVGGTVADLFRASDRGSAMSLFSLMIFLGQASPSFGARSDMLGSRRDSHGMDRHEPRYPGTSSFRLGTTLTSPVVLRRTSSIRYLVSYSLLQIQGIACAFSCVLNLLFLRETRGDVLLARKAKRLTKATGSKYVCAADLQRQSFLTLLHVSLIRPFGRS